MIEKLVDKIKQANIAYRTGNAIMEDSEYDSLLDQLKLIDPYNELFDLIGYEVTNETRKAQLPIPMFSMNKIKTIQEIWDWCKSKDISLKEFVIITPKFDGLSLCVNEGDGCAFTRGDGIYGQRSDEHYKLIGNKNIKSGVFKYTYGETIMPKKTFMNKYSTEFSNPRNLVSGLLNSDEATESLRDCHYIRYGGVINDGVLISTKEEILNNLNNEQDIKVKYEKCKISQLTEEYLLGLFNQWSDDYEIDGLIIEINSLDVQEQLGRERNNNPCWARAYKSPDFEKSIESEVIGITWNISKNGLLKPVVNIKPVKLDGVTISNVTGNNARYIKNNGIGTGSVVVIKRSGAVIPKIVNVLKSVPFAMPSIDNIKWNDNGVELVTTAQTDEQEIKKIVAFFHILEAENISEGIITQIYNSGYKTIREFLSLTVSDLEKIEGFRKRRSQIIYQSIKECLKDVSLSKLMHASGLFNSLGSKKLALLEHFSAKPSIEDVLKIDGFAEISAMSFVYAYDEFYKFIDGLPITIKKEEFKKSDELSGSIFVFTGVRRPDLVKIIESKGGKESSSVSKNTTHLICVDKNSTSSKIKKAMDLNIKIMDVEELENLLNN